jgi:hypothetical protein
MDAIDVVFSSLKIKGWEPEIIGINDYSVDHDDGMYSGGHCLKLFCNFN